MISGPNSKTIKPKTQITGEAVTPQDIKNEDQNGERFFYVNNLVDFIEHGFRKIQSGAMSKEEVMETIRQEVQTSVLLASKKITPGNYCKLFGIEDDFANYTAMERSNLSMGYLSDDQLANGAFMNYDVRPPIADIISGRSFSPIVWMTAVKERIRWLSRRVSVLEGHLLKLAEGRPDKDEILSNIHDSIRKTD